MPHTSRAASTVMSPVETPYATVERAAPSAADAVSARMPKRRLSVLTQPYPRMRTMRLTDRTTPTRARLMPNALAWSGSTT
jgi:hypothetical protein